MTTGNAGGRYACGVIGIASNGYTLYAANAALGVVAEINLNEFRVTRTTQFDPGSPITADTLTQTARSVISPDGATVYFTSGWDVWAYDTKARNVSGPFPTHAPLNGLGVSKDGQWLFVAQKDGRLMTFNTTAATASQ